MNECITLKEFEGRWRSLLKNGALLHPFEINSDEQDGDDDPFDCSSIAVPPNYKSVDRVVETFAVEWKDLDDRKVQSGKDDTSDYSLEESSERISREGDVSNSRKRKRNSAKASTSSNPKWYEKHVRLPENFDYATRQAEQPADDGNGDRVLSLEDPTISVAYHQELWKLFARIPTAEQLEQEAIANARVVNTQKVYDEIVQADSKTLVDAHALSRLRLADRHDAPPQPPLRLENHRLRRDNEGNQHTMVATLRWEFWKREPRRGPWPDPNRMVVEMKGIETLKDLHNLIVEQTDDDLWNRARASAETHDSGIFFIEGVFYSTGTTDYVSPIKAWIQNCGTKRKQEKLAERLGLSLSAPDIPVFAVHSMEDTRLEDLSLRLGVRYLHIHHGDIECSVIAIDRRLAPVNSTTTRYPIFHDIWTKPYNIPDCDLCKHAPAVIATSASCEITGGHRALCEACSRQLQLQSKVPKQIERYTTWRDQDVLSTAANADRYF